MLCFDSRDFFFQKQIHNFTYLFYNFKQYVFNFKYFYFVLILNLLLQILFLNLIKIPCNIRDKIFLNIEGGFII